jgi:hypothetical protein
MRGFRHWRWHLGLVQISIPRSNSGSSTFRSDSGKRTYIITQDHLGGRVEIAEGGCILGGRGITFR